MSYDPFRPRSEPACLLYDALVKESAKRGERSVQEWQEKELQVVLHTAPIGAAAGSVGARAGESISDLLLGVPAGETKEQRDKRMSDAWSNGAAMGMIGVPAMVGFRAFMAHLREQRRKAVA